MSQSATGISVSTQLIVVNPRGYTTTDTGIAVTPKLIEVQPAIIKIKPVGINVSPTGQDPSSSPPRQHCPQSLLHYSCLLCDACVWLCLLTSLIAHLWRRSPCPSVVTHSACSCGFQS